MTPDMDEELESFREQFSNSQQDTKREIGKYLYDHPREEHTPEEIHEAIDVDVVFETVENNLSTLKEESDQIEQEKELVYRWSGEGRPKSLSETAANLQTAFVEIFTQEQLGGAYIPTMIALIIFMAGITNGIFVVLLSLLGRDSLWGVTANETIAAAGTSTTVASAALLVIPIILGIERALGWR
jgi:hypothetical protein